MQGGFSTHASTHASGSASLSPLRTAVEPMVQQYDKVLEVDLAVAVDIAGDGRFAQRLAEIRFAGLSCAAIGAHVDHAPVGKRLVADGAVRITCVDTRTRDVVDYPQLSLFGSQRPV